MAVACWNEMQEEVLHWGPNFFSQNGAQPLVYVVVLLMSQHFRRAAEYMGDQAELQEHGTHLAIACNHLKVGPCLHFVTCKTFQPSPTCSHEFPVCVRRPHLRYCQRHT